MIAHLLFRVVSLSKQKEPGIKFKKKRRIQIDGDVIVLVCPIVHVCQKGFINVAAKHIVIVKNNRYRYLNEASE